MEHKNSLIRNGIITAVIVLLVLVIPFVRFRWINITPDTVGSISVRNGLSGNLFEINERDSVVSLLEMVNEIGPVFGLRAGAPGYVYLLVFYAPDGSEVDRITLVSENEVVIDNFTGNTNISDVLDYLSDIETGITK